jgi:hypothetical protein
MIVPRQAVPFLFLAAGACASAGSAGGPSEDATLAYTLPSERAATYVQADSIMVSVDAGGQSFEVDQISVATFAMEFAPAGGGVEVSATYVDLDASVANPMSGTQRATEEDVDGPIVFTLSPTGEATLGSFPTVSGPAAQLIDIPTWAATFFPRLPAEAVGPGYTWRDTVTAESERADGVIVSRSIVDYTVAGDTTLAGQSLVRVTFTSQDERRSDITQQGMAMTQDLGGTGRGWFLWDPARGLFHSQSYTAAFTGSMEVAGAPFPLGLVVEARSHIRPAAGG